MKSKKDSIFPIEFQNNRESQLQVEEHFGHFSGQNEEVFEHLMKGGNISSRTAMNIHRIGDVRPRIASIIKAGFVVREKKIYKGNGAKVWWMEEEDILQNIEISKQLKNK